MFLKGKTEKMNALYQRIFGLSPSETTFAKRGFRGDNRQARPRLEHIGATFLCGYHSALADTDADRLAHQLAAIDNEMRGFAYEGAAMGLALRDMLAPWRHRRLPLFLAGPGDAHKYMVHIGAGWLPARLNLPVEGWMRTMDPLLRWLALDGYGFHQGYFAWPQYVDRQQRPSGLVGYALRAFDQGLGRSIWFVEGADVSRIPRTLAAFEPQRRADLWSGIGLACAYAGGVGADELTQLKEMGAQFLPQMAQGAAFAAEARRRAGNAAEHTDLACRILCGAPATEAAQVTIETLPGLVDSGNEPAFEQWRRRIQDSLSRRKVAAQ